MTNDDDALAFTDPLSGLLGYQLRRASAAAMADLAGDLAAEDFSAALASVLLMIESNPGETQARIGRELSIKRANIAPMIARLEEAGLIRKESIDGRSFGLVITQRGESRAARLRHLFRIHDARAFGSLTDRERRQLHRLLERVHGHLRVSESQ